DAGGARAHGAGGGGDRGHRRGDPARRRARTRAGGRAQGAQAEPGPAPRRARRRARHDRGAGRRRRAPARDRGRPHARARARRAGGARRRGRHLRARSGRRTRRRGARLVRPVRLLVVGAGHMGRLHAAKAARALPGAATLIGVADRHLERAEALARQLGGGVRAAAEPRALAGAADAAIVAVPTVAHAAVADALLDAGLDLLVEKPIAATLAEAEALVARARAAGRVLQVGHLEWHNPALVAVRGRIRRPRFVEAHRLGPFPGRATDVDVVRDLMIHDLDVVQRLLGEEPASLEAIGAPV